MDKKCKTLYDLKKAKKRKKVLKYKVYLQGLEAEIKEMGFQEMDIQCYRVVHNPASENNFLPQKFMPGRKDKLPIIPAEGWNNFSSDKKKRHISNCTLSHFLSEEDCRKMMHERYQKDIKRMGQEEATQRKINLGTHIVKMNYLSFASEF